MCMYVCMCVCACVYIFRKLDTNSKNLTSMPIKKRKKKYILNIFLVQEQNFFFINLFIFVLFIISFV